MPLRVRECDDADFDNLGAKDNFIWKYNATTDKFDMINADNLLLQKIQETAIFDQQFVNTVSSELIQDNIPKPKFDGGEF